jgi:hypothetical protein
MLITGAGKRIGCAIALDLAEHGWGVAVHYFTSKVDADDVVAEIRGKGGRAAAIQADLGKEAEVSALTPAADQGQWHRTGTDAQERPAEQGALRRPVGKRAAEAPDLTAGNLQRRPIPDRCIGRDRADDRTGRRRASRLGAAGPGIRPSRMSGSVSNRCLETDTSCSRTCLSFKFCTRPARWTRSILSTLKNIDIATRGPLDI